MLSKCTQWPGSHPARVCCTHSLAGRGLDLGRKEEAGNLNLNPNFQTVNRQPPLTISGGSVSFMPLLHSCWSPRFSVQQKPASPPPRSWALQWAHHPELILPSPSPSHFPRCRSYTGSYPSPSPDRPPHSFSPIKPVSESSLHCSPGPQIPQKKTLKLPPRPLSAFPD